MKIRDLTKFLKKDIDIKRFFPLIELKVKEKETKKNTKDLFSKLKDINISDKQKVKVYKNRTKNFDSFVKNRLWFFKLKDPIDLSYLSKIKVYFKHKTKAKKVFNFNFIKSFFIFLKEIIINKSFPVYLLLFSLIVLTLLYFDKIFIEEKVRLSYERLIKIKDNPKDINFIKKQVNDSKFDFALADFLFYPFSLIDNPKINNAYYIIKWWKDLTYSLDKILLIYDKITKYIKEKKLDNIELSSLLINIRKEIKDFEIWLEKTVNSYKQINNLWMPDIEDKIKLYTAKLKIALFYLKEINNNFDLLLDILWDKEKKQYLIVFQNADEIRPMWGFMWSMWILDIYKWKVLKFEKKDIYAYEWDLKSIKYNRYNAPEWLNKITEKFWLRDSNYFVQTKDSSETIKFFMNKLWYNIDGIIYINQNIILDFLDNTWDIDFKQIWETINSSNFSQIISILVEAKLFKVWTLWTPKKILFDFIENFVKRLKEKGDYYNYINILLNSIKKRDLVVYLFDKDDNKFIKELWLDSSFKFWDTLDFSYPVFTSISWNKSDRYIKREFEKTLKINRDCSIDTNLNIRLKHTFSKKDEENINYFFNKYNILDKNLLNIQWKWDNYQYIRLLLPKDVIVRKNNNIKVKYHETKTSVEFYIRTKKGEVKDFNVFYHLDNPKCMDYDFKFYKQPWIRDYNLKLNIEENNIFDKFNLDKDFYYNYNDFSL